MSCVPVIRYVSEPVPLMGASQNLLRFVFCFFFSFPLVGTGYLEVVGLGLFPFLRSVMLIRASSMPQSG